MEVGRLIVDRGKMQLQDSEKKEKRKWKSRGEDVDEHARGRIEKRKRMISSGE
jgi:hypothetical protein